MADLIIKPSSGNSLVFQDEGGDPALTVGTTGNTTLAGTANNLGTASGILTLNGGSILNHDAKENSWSRYATGQVDIASAAVLNFTAGYQGSNITHSSGRMTCTVAGLYLIMLNMSQHSRGNRDLAFNLRKNTTNVPGFYLYEDSAGDGTYYSGSAAIIMVDVAANDILDIYGTGNYSGAADSQTCWSGIRLGAIS